MDLSTAIDLHNAQGFSTHVLDTLTLTVISDMMCQRAAIGGTLSFEVYAFCWQLLASVSLGLILRWCGVAPHEADAWGTFQYEVGHLFAKAGVEL